MRDKANSRCRHTARQAKSRTSKDPEGLAGRLDVGNDEAVIY
jgi:hypothetical protein